MYAGVLLQNLVIVPPSKWGSLDFFLLLDRTFVEVAGTRKWGYWCASFDQEVLKIGLENLLCDLQDTR